MAEQLTAPFPWFGGKRKIAAEVWRRFGDVKNYVEPFFGGGAVLLGSPYDPPIRTVNDLNGFVANFWRAVAADPEAVAYWADWPVNENDLHARHVWLVEQKPTLRGMLEGDPDWHDAKIAGWWCWGMCQWIGGRFCDDRSGPWWPQEMEDGTRQLVRLGDAGKGVKRPRVNLGNAGRGVSRQRVQLGDAGQGVRDWMQRLADKMRRVRVCCGDWTRVTGGAVTTTHGLTAVFLDPPYLFATSCGKKRDKCYGDNDDGEVANAVRQWCIDNGDDPKLRIALCGYEGEHKMPDGWTEWAWKAQGGMASQGSRGEVNRHRERVWFSPQCLPPEVDLFRDPYAPTA